ncbi:MmgE/PrpD family protein [Pseudoroseomonas cervicalis]|uniref:MmgE/PrpD family protein n=1 Tax=Teichococcus cervicalis TaxID=204525 RepID=UPI0027818F98|nr:MmgE/PrpD family protein [Pseudoroseomonas cervicalis]MDQ1081852.1 2-methylcitrate dehydratase PrpD [Pseudoroseomonas cervicalis]
MTASASEALGAFIAGSRPGSLDPALRHEGKRALLNFFGGALGVARDPAVEVAIRVMAPFSGPGRTTLIGRAERLDAMGSAFVNCIAANLLDYDDTHLETVIHPTAAVAPPLLALAELRGLSGAALLHAFILGAEVECRIGCAVSPGHYARGWHITSTCGVFGAAAGAAWLLGLDAAGCAAALGIAASQSAGLVENLPTAAKNVGMGNAARNGLLAALFAEAGYSAAPTALEGPLGWARAMGDAPDTARITAGLGRHWEFARITYKPYPAGIVFHAVIDAALALREHVAPDAIADIIIAGDQLLLDRGDRPLRNARDARVSIHHAAAIGLLRGSAGVADFSEEAVADPALAALRGKVRAELDASLPRGAARVTLRLKNGTQCEAIVQNPRGSETRPMSDVELEGKYRANAPGPQAAAQIARLWALEEARDIGALMRAFAAPGPAPIAG